MSKQDKADSLTAQQERVLKLLFKFRFISSPLLADVMGIKNQSIHPVLELLKDKGYITKVYDESWRIDRRPAYYYLSKTGVSTVRKLLDVKEAAVHTLYRNDEASEDFITHCLVTASCYTSLKHQLPPNTEIFTKAEVGRFSEFPKNRPDLYIRTPDNQEAIVVIMDDKPLYITRKRLSEIIDHSENEGWDGEYPRICVVLKNGSDKNSLLYTTRKQLETLGMDEGELTILATHLKLLKGESDCAWASAFHPKSFVRLFE